MKSAISAAILGAALAAAGSTTAAGNAALEAPIHQFIEAFNKGDIKTAAATHLSTGVSIVDEVRPHIWQGPGAFMAWAGALTADDKADGVTNESVTLGAVTREVVEADTAYVIIGATYSFKQKGKAMHEPAQMTYAMKKTAQGWKIAGWTWTGPNPTPVK
jgi:ketosteroid isomerase-like protein